VALLNGNQSFVGVNFLTNAGNLFAGNGSGLNNLNTSSLTAGTAPAAQLGSGTANATTFLRGDSTWATPPGGVAATFNNNQFGSANGLTNLIAGVTLTNIVADNGGGDLLVPSISSSGAISIGNTNIGGGSVLWGAGTWGIMQSIAVPFMRPNTPESGCAFDVMPNTTNAYGITTWVDVCSTDVANINNRPGVFSALALQCDAGGNGEIYTHTGFGGIAGALMLQSEGSPFTGSTIVMRGTDNGLADIQMYGTGEGLLWATQGASQSWTINPTQCMTSFNNNGAIGSVTLTLPTSVPGLHFVFAVVTPQPLIIQASGSDTITSANVTGAPGGTASSSAVGSTVELFCPVNGQWFFLGSSGTWAIN
jgi:hypothetical protein